MGARTIRTDIADKGRLLLALDALKKGDFSLLYCSHRMQRALSEIPLVRNVLQTIWHQVHQAQQVVVIGTILEDGHVMGGTGWGAELGRIWKKPLWVYDQPRRGWFHWDGAWAPCEPPLVTSESFAGMGTQNLTDEGRAAIDDLFARSFG